MTQLNLEDFFPTGHGSSELFRERQDPEQEAGA